MRGRKAFYLDKGEGKLMGVCAGIANATGWDANLIRIGIVLVTLLGAFPWTLVAYGALAWIGRKRPGLRELDEVAPPRRSVREVRDTMRDLDRRLAEVDSIVASSNSSLAREIDGLR
jgi:phage shock protein C